MNKITKHPLYQKSDEIKRALFLNGFTFFDRDESRELIETEASVELFHEPEKLRARQMTTGDGSYSLRTRLLPEHLPLFPKNIPLRAAVSGRIYDGSDTMYPQHERIEGVIADKSITITDLSVLWQKIIQNIYGIHSCVSLEPESNGSFSINVGTKGSDLTFGYLGPGTWVARSILGITDSSISLWIFTIDVDMIVIHDLSLAHRKDLYDTRLSFTGILEDSTPFFGDLFSARAADVMRKMGYCQFIGERFYTDDAYVRMNMVQEAWDTNNKGILLQDPLKGYNNPLTSETERAGLPTVLTPALEQAMSDNFSAGEKSLRIFELGHIFKPGKNGEVPWETISLSVGAYGPEVNFKSFLTEIKTILQMLGISNSFFIPTDLAIAYRQDQCMVILDEKMKYLDGNCGHISPVALKNFRIDTEGFMAQFELPSLEAKAREEYGFVPYELR